jgi:hypothetical protein
MPSIKLANLPAAYKSIVSNAKRLSGWHYR